MLPAPTVTYVFEEKQMSRRHGRGVAVAAAENPSMLGHLLTSAMVGGWPSMVGDNRDTGATWVVSGCYGGQGVWMR